MQVRSWTVLGSGGRLVSTVAPPDPARADAMGAEGQFVFTPPSGETLARIASLIDSGKLRPPEVALDLPLGDARRAHELGESGRAGGKIVLQVGHP
jgi:NADPH:quinone reductase-like Zn-dependent oxidoreductase